MPEKNASNPSETPEKTPAQGQALPGDQGESAPKPDDALAQESECRDEEESASAGDDRNSAGDDQNGENANQESSAESPAIAASEDRADADGSGLKGESGEDANQASESESSAGAASETDAGAQELPGPDSEPDADLLKDQASSINAGESAPGGAGEAKKDQPDEEEEPGGKPMGLLDHLNELRWRLVKAAIAVACGFAICWAFVDPLFNILLDPLLSVLPKDTHAQYTTLPEAFFTRMTIAFVAGFFLASPVIFYQIWAFVAPGLYDEEKRYIIPIAICSALFFISGALFCYYIVFPFAFAFFISYSTPEIVITPKVSDYLSFTLKLLFAFGIIFEMPIFTLFLARLGIVTAAMMRRARKYAIVGIFILAAILTPPDVISQLMMACPMLALYELSIGIAVIFGHKPKKETENDDPADTKSEPAKKEQ